MTSIEPVEYVFTMTSLLGLTFSGITYLNMIVNDSILNKDTGIRRSVLNICISNIIWGASSSFGYISPNASLCSAQAITSSSFLKASLFWTATLIYELYIAISKSMQTTNLPSIEFNYCFTFMSTLIWAVSILSSFLPYIISQNISVYGALYGGSDSWCFLQGDQSNLYIITTFNSMLFISLVVSTAVLLHTQCSIDVTKLDKDAHKLYQSMKMYFYSSLMCFSPILAYLLMCNIAALSNSSILPDDSPLYNSSLFAATSIFMQTYGSVFSLCFGISRSKLGPSFLNIFCGRQQEQFDEFKAESEAQSFRDIDKKRVFDQDRPRGKSLSENEEGRRSRKGSQAVTERSSAQPSFQAEYSSFAFESFEGAPDSYRLSSRTGSFKHTDRGSNGSPEYTRASELRTTPVQVVNSLRRLTAASQSEANALSVSPDRSWLSSAPEESKSATQRVQFVVQKSDSRLRGYTSVSETDDTNSLRISPAPPRPPPPPRDSRSSSAAEAPLSGKSHGSSILSPDSQNRNKSFFRSLKQVSHTLKSFQIYS